jgi:hypothetical protein
VGDVLGLGVLKQFEQTTRFRYIAPFAAKVGDPPLLVGNVLNALGNVPLGFRQELDLSLVIHHLARTDRKSISSIQNTPRGTSPRRVEHLALALPDRCVQFGTDRQELRRYFTIVSKGIRRNTSSCGIGEQALCSSN